MNFGLQGSLFHTVISEGKDKKGRRKGRDLRVGCSVGLLVGRIGTSFVVKSLESVAATEDLG